TGSVVGSVISVCVIRPFFSLLDLWKQYLQKRFHYQTLEDHKNSERRELILLHKQLQRQELDQTKSQHELHREVKNTDTISQFAHTAAGFTPQSSEKKDHSYCLPDIDLFYTREVTSDYDPMQQELHTKAQLLEKKLERFGIFGAVVAIKQGPVVTLFEYVPHIDTKLSKIMGLEDD